MSNRTTTTTSTPIGNLTNANLTNQPRGFSSNVGGRGLMGQLANSNLSALSAAASLNQMLALQSLQINASNDTSQFNPIAAAAAALSSNQEADQASKQQQQQHLQSLYLLLLAAQRSPPDLLNMLINPGMLKAYQQYQLTQAHLINSLNLNPPPPPPPPPHQPHHHLNNNPLLGAFDTIPSALFPNLTTTSQADTNPYLRDLFLLKSKIF